MPTTKKSRTASASKGSKTTKKTTKGTKKKSTSTSNPIPRTYSTVLRHLLNRTNYERVRVVNFNEKTFKLDRMRKLLKKLGNPQDGLRTIHVASTVCSTLSR